MVVCTQENMVVNKCGNERERWQLFMEIMTLKSVCDYGEKWNSYEITLVRNNTWGGNSIVKVVRT